VLPDVVEDSPDAVNGDEAMGVPSSSLKPCLGPRPGFSFLCPKEQKWNEGIEWKDEWPDELWVESELLCGTGEWCIGAPEDCSGWYDWFATENAGDWPLSSLPSLGQCHRLCEFLCPVSEKDLEEQLKYLLVEAECGGPFSSRSECWEEKLDKMSGETWEEMKEQTSDEEWEQAEDGAANRLCITGLGNGLECSLSEACVLVTEDEWCFEACIDEQRRVGVCSAEE